MTIIIFILFAGFILLVACSLAYSAHLGDMDERYEPRRPCAWCDKENGVKRLGNVSHGICPRHAAEMERESKELL